MSESVEALTRRAVDFHGHLCPGLAIGIKAAQIGLAEFGRDGDEDIVALVETDMCGVDAIQALMGCTFGKGNLVFRDHGKMSFTFYRRRDGASLRLATRPESERPGYETFTAFRRELVKRQATPGDAGKLEECKQACVRQLLAMDPEALFDRKPAQEPEPPMARLYQSVPCSLCGEPVMESRIRLRDGQPVCIPCLRRA
jgi:formylmethanofuran dehydrogenase subunit E